MGANCAGCGRPISEDAALGARCADCQKKVRAPRVTEYFASGLRIADTEKRAPPKRKVGEPPGCMGDRLQRLQEQEDGPPISTPYLSRWHTRTETDERPPPKQKAGKPRVDLVPYEVDLIMAEVLEYGAEKYVERAWERDERLEVTDLLAAGKRHLGQTMNALVGVPGYQMRNGEDGGLDHLEQAAVDLMMAAVLRRRRGDR